MPTLDERIAAARKLEGYTPGSWECFHGLQTDNWHSAVYGPAGDYDALLIAVCNQNDSHRADAVLIAAAPDLHRLVLDLAAERERLLSALRLIGGKGNQVYCRDGHEECALLARAALAPETRA